MSMITGYSVMSHYPHVWAFTGNGRCVSPWSAFTGQKWCISALTGDYLCGGGGMLQHHFANGGWNQRRWEVRNAHLWRIWLMNVFVMQWQLTKREHLDREIWRGTLCVSAPCAIKLHCWKGRRKVKVNKIKALFVVLNPACFCVLI